MKLNSRLIAIFTGLSGFLAVLMGAAAAHWLAAIIAVEDLARIEKASTYQIYHTLALLALLPLLEARPSLTRSAVAFMVGIILFSGSLYAYSFSHWHPLVFITPLGGLSFMAGWLYLAIALSKPGNNAPL